MSHSQPQYTPPQQPAPTPERPWYKKKRWVIPLGFLALCIVVAPFSGSSDDSPTANNVKITDQPADSESTAADQPSEVTTSAAKKPVAAPPKKKSQEEQFIALVAGARDKADDADNDFQRRLPLTNRNKAICKLLDSKKVKNWTGEVTELNTNGDGLGVLEIEIADDIKVSTWNNALSDFEDNTLIQTDSPVFEAMSSLNEGDKVRFTGTFTRDAKNCIGEQSLTDNGSSQTPTFTMKFSSLSAVS
jgi:hypothetical protein